MSKAKLICMTPIKNEAWILDKFLAAASVWADHIIIADQHSDDGSKEIALKYKKVIYIENNSKEFNEPERQKLLITEARKIPGKKLLVALDADEFISGDAFESADWKEMINAEPGTVFKFKWPFITNTFDKYWAGETAKMPFAYMDDGAEHVGSKIHSIRIPFPKHAKEQQIHDFVVMHFMYTDWKRMQSKHRWYQCYERCEYPKKSVIAIFRRYNHMYRVRDSEKNIIPDSWFITYSKLAINLKSTVINQSYYWDPLVDEMVKAYGKEYFKYIDLPNNNNWLLKYLRKTRGFEYLLIEKIFDKMFGGIK
ncbi:glycosyltransferase family 2 protein [Agarivorans sp. QJM3NY_25]|uniref:glycosyltransferase family 2 protein n=1 Tax=Agarivorans sp. QJM3NY_25 TaxID=3421430 RepID=UPI003D7C9AE1